MYHDPQLFFLLGKTLCVEHTTPEGYAQFMQATRQPPHQEQEPFRCFESYCWF